MSRARTPGCCMLRPAARLTSHVRRHWRGARFVRTVSVDPNLGADLGEEGPRLSTRAEKRDFAVAQVRPRRAAPLSIGGIESVGAHYDAFVSVAPQFSQIAGAAPHLAARLPDFGILRPNPVQRVAFDPIYEGKDVVLEAPTGYGKTLAFALPLLSKLELRRAEPQVRAPVVCSAFPALPALSYAGVGRRCWFCARRGSLPCKRTTSSTSWRTLGGGTGRGTPFASARCGPPGAGARARARP